MIFMGLRRLERSARRALDHLHDQLGTVGLVAAATVPGLAAALDQHEAAVRDILTTGVESGATVAGAVLLAGYARGIQDHVRERGLSLAIPADAREWRTATWFHVRLLAVCSLARNVLPGHPVAARHDLPSLA